MTNEIQHLATVASVGHMENVGSNLKFSRGILVIALLLVGSVSASDQIVTNYSWANVGLRAQSVAVDRAGNLYVGRGETIQKVTPSGVVTVTRPLLLSQCMC